jgi:transcriptional regulator with XRE-family HTH domain
MATIYDPAYQRIVARLREARQHTGLTQAEVAKKLRRPQSYVSRAEAGQHRLDVLELLTFARIYGQPIDFFIQDATEPRRGRSRR